MKTVYIIFATLSFAYSATIPSVLAEDDDTGYAWYIDQDLFGADFAISKNDDRDYTMGLEYTFSGSRVEKTVVYKQMSHWLDTTSDLMRLGSSRDDSLIMYSHSGSIGDTAFTPYNLSKSTPISGDRPYANLFYVSTAETFIIEEDGATRGQAGTNKLVIGVLGLDIGKVVQTEIHDLTNGREPRGWDNQVSEGGELTALYSHRRHYEWLSTGDKDWIKPEISWLLDGSIGYYTEIGAGMQIRFGRVKSPYYQHLSDPLSNTNQLYGPDKDNYIFFSFGARAIAYNALLQGQFRSSAATIDNDDIRRLVGHASFGYVYDFEKLKLTYALNYRSSQIRGGEGDREHYFGGIYLTFQPEKQ